MSFLDFIGAFSFFGTDGEEADFGVVNAKFDFAVI